MSTNLEIEPIGPTSNKVFRVKRGDVVLGTAYWREWPHATGYHWCPRNSAQKHSRVLRSTLFEALTKAAKIKTAEAREAIAAI